MKLSSVVAVALLAAAPTFASAFTIDFETNWGYGVDVAGYYAGGTASDGSRGPNLGVAFTNVSGLSNDAGFTYYGNAPSGLGTAYAHTFAAGDTAFIDIASGVGRGLTFYYSSPSSIAGALKAYSGLDGTGSLLSIFDLVANTASIDGVANYDTWTRQTFAFGGIARSFDLTAAANVVLFDAISSVPEPGTWPVLMIGALAAIGASTVRRARRG